MGYRCAIRQSYPSGLLTAGVDISVPPGLPFSVAPVARQPGGVGVPPGPVPGQRYVGPTFPVALVIQPVPDREPLPTSFFAMSHFVWTRVGSNAGQDIKVIAARKEAEREAGGGEFWWGVGSSLGPALRAAVEAEGPLPVVFSHMLSGPRSS